MSDSIDRRRILDLEHAVHRLAALAEHYGVEDVEGYRAEILVLLRADWLYHEAALKSAREGRRQWQLVARARGGSLADLSAQTQDAEPEGR